MVEKEFFIALFRLFVYVSSLVILLPLVISGDNTLFVSLIIYTFGKFIDYLEKIMLEGSRYLFRLRMVLLIMTFVIGILCIYPYSGAHVGRCFMNGTVIAVFATCLIDVIELSYVVQKYYNTKAVIKEGRG